MQAGCDQAQQGGREQQRGIRFKPNYYQRCSKTCLPHQAPPSLPPTLELCKGGCLVPLTTKIVEAEIIMIKVARRDCNFAENPAAAAGAAEAPPTAREPPNLLAGMHSRNLLGVLPVCQLHVDIARLPVRSGSRGPRIRLRGATCAPPHQAASLQQPICHLNPDQTTCCRLPVPRSAIRGRDPRMLDSLARCSLIF